jgi:hypothetical protein
VATGNVIISVRGGSTDRPEVELAAGTPADAFSVGSEGSWVVSGPGVSTVHAYLYFDGMTLFVASAPGMQVALGTEAVGTDWKALAIPARISLGGVALDVRIAGRPPATPRRSVPPRAPEARQPRPAAGAQPTRVPTHGPGRSVRPTSKPVRPPGQMMASAPPAAAPTPGASGYDDSDAPTQYQPMPEGFSASSPSIPDSATQVRDVSISEDPTTSDERTHVMSPPSEAEPPAAAATPYAAPVAPQPMARTQALGGAARPERPEPPSNRPPTDAATVVKPLEQFLAEANARPQAPSAEAPDTAKRPLAAPTPAAGQPPPARGAAGVVIAPPEATSPPGAGFRWQGHQPGAPGQPAQPGAYGAVPPGYAAYAGAMPQGGVEVPAQPGLPTPMGYAQQQYPGAMPGQQLPQQPGVVGFPPQPGQVWPVQPQQATPSKDPLALWKAMPFPRKLMIIMLPFGLVAFIVIFAPDRQHATRAKPAGSGSARTSLSGAPPPGSVPLTTSAAPTVSGAPTPTAPTPAPTDTTPAPTDTAPAPATATAAPTESAEPEKLPRGQVTQERQAADAVAAGDIPKAVALYEQLAKEHPENAAFARAAEILRRRLKK